VLLGHRKRLHTAFAQENDGERAVRAALAIQRTLADLNARNAATGAPELSARIGLESGRVVVDSSGEVFGEAPNVAAVLSRAERRSLQSCWRRERERASPSTLPGWLERFLRGLGVGPSSLTAAIALWSSAGPSLGAPQFAPAMMRIELPIPSVPVAH
jgi:hypothetical protein